MEEEKVEGRNILYLTFCDGMFSTAGRMDGRNGVGAGAGMLSSQQVLFFLSRIG